MEKSKLSRNQKELQKLLFLNREIINLNGIDKTLSGARPLSRLVTRNAGLNEVDYTVVCLKLSKLRYEITQLIVETEQNHLLNYQPKLF